jgi:thiosulfate/3-mercaptopyruvate sulfurtransferase
MEYSNMRYNSQGNGVSEFFSYPLVEFLVERNTMKITSNAINLFCLMLLFANFSFSHENKFIVSTEWLSEHLDDGNIILLFVGKKDVYDKGHILGSRYIAFDEFAPTLSGLYRQMPSVEDLETLFEGYGISDDSRIVLYTDEQITPTARLYVTLDYLGLGKNILFLDGGLTKWKSENRSVTTEMPARKTGTINPKVNDILATKDYLLKKINDSSITIIDARTQDFYSATDDKNYYPRPGHITGAINIPFITLTSKEPPYTFKSKSELKEIFKSASVHKDNVVITYCHIGQQASLVYFVGKMLGYNMKLYDGSFQEWSPDEDCPVTGKKE